MRGDILSKFLPAADIEERHSSSHIKAIKVTRAGHCVGSCAAIVEGRQLISPQPGNSITACNIEHILSISLINVCVAHLAGTGLSVHDHVKR